MNIKTNYYYIFAGRRGSRNERNSGFSNRRKKGGTELGIAVQGRMWRRWVIWDFGISSWCSERREKKIVNKRAEEGDETVSFGYFFFYLFWCSMRCIKKCHMRLVINVLVSKIPPCQHIHGLQMSQGLIVSNFFNC